MLRYKIAMIGLGQIAKSHLEGIRRSDRVKLTSVADLLEDKLQEMTAQYHISAYKDYREMVIMEKPDVVIISLPHFLHKEAAIWCMEQGCHVLLEKPMAMNAQECLEINEAAVRNKARIAIGHMQRFFPINIQAKAIIDSGELGELRMINDKRYGDYFRIMRPRWFLEKAKSGGGVVINLGSHSIDRIQWLAGSAISTVQAVLTYPEGYDVEGSASLFMRDERGIPIHISLSGYPSVGTNETELLFTKGRLRIDYSGELAILRNGQCEKVDIPAFPHAFLTQLHALLDAIEHGQELSISGEYGQSVIAVVDAVYLSHHTNTEQQVAKYSLEPHTIS